MAAIRAPNKPERWQRRKPITARQLNQSIDVLRAAASGVAAARQLSPGAKSTQAELRQFQIESIESDYLICNAWDGTADGETQYYVAKPPMLRGSLESHNGVTFSAYSGDATARTATLGATSETQSVVPAYVSGDVIYAARNVKGGSGVTRSDGGATVPVVWVDLNVDGRAWAKDAA